jgi:hypothetical protein
LATAGRRRTIRLIVRRALIAFAAAVVVAVCLVVVSPALATGIGARLEAGLEHMVEHGISASTTYAESNHGKAKGSATVGIVGHGTFSTKVGASASVAASILGAVKGIPLTSLLAGGSYVARYDSDQNGNYHGLFVATFTHGLGSICVDFAITHGAFKPGSSFIPASGTMKSLGGSGLLASLHGTAEFTQTDVTGSDVEKFADSGKLLSVATGAKAPMSAACQAVARLAKA